MTCRGCSTTVLPDTSKPPSRHQVIVIGLLQRRACGRHPIVGGLDELGCGPEIGLKRSGRAARRVEIKFVLVDHHRQPRRHTGDKGGESAERHRLFVRLPVVASFGDAFKHAAGQRRFAIQFAEKQLRQFHRMSPRYGRASAFIFAICAPSARRSSRLKIPRAFRNMSPSSSWM
jgi:hypothetical protein